MNASSSNRPSGGSRSRIMLTMSLTMIIVLLAVIVYLVAPRRIREIVVIGDDGSVWRQQDAPIVRKIVWKRAVPFESPTFELAEARDSLFRPQLAENGTVLYFALRKPAADIDIYRSNLVNGEWQPAKPVEELNTEFDDIGPVIQPGEKRLYLFSNRDGGFGSFDLYSSKRTDEGWSEPTNLGPRINSPAKEYDPAVSADGKRLFFASNRSREMHQKMAESESPDQGNPWTSTVRADLGTDKFDLYMAQRESADKRWNPAVPLDDVNRANSDEATPYVSLSGAFLYFASDRLAPGEQLAADQKADLDIYRARIRGDRVTDIENLGPGVNTERNELEPSLSAEGFQIFFSRDVDPETGKAQGVLNEKYALFRSDAAEVEEAVSWESGPWRAITSFIGENWFWLLLCVLLLLAAAALAWLLLQVYHRRVALSAIAICMIIALLLHTLGGVGSFFVYFADQLVAKITKEMERNIEATQLSSEDAHQSHRAEKQAYEKVADLKSLETERVSELERRVTQTPNVPMPADAPVMMVPMKLTHEAAPDRPSITLPQSEIDSRETPQFNRLRKSVDAIAHVRIEMEKTAAVKRQMEKELARAEIKVDRRNTPTPTTDAPQSFRRRTAAPSMVIEREALTAEREEQNPIQAVAQHTPRKIERADRPKAESTEMASVESETLEAPTPGLVAEQTPEETDVTVGRQTPTHVGESPKELAPRTTISATHAALQPAEAEMSAERADRSPTAPTSESTSAKISRTDRDSAGPSGDSASQQVESEEIVLTGASSDGNLAQGQLAGEAISVGRTAATTQSGAPGLVRHSADGPIASSPARAGESLELVAAAAAGPQSSKVIGQLARADTAGRAAAARIAADSIEAEASIAGAPVTKAAKVAAVDVGVKRADQQLLKAPATSASAFGGLHNPDNPRLVVGTPDRVALDAPLSVSTVGSRILRRRSRAPSVTYADDRIGLEALLERRQISDVQKRILIKESGGDDKTLDAIHRGLAWISQHQHPDGHWGLHDFHSQCKGHKCNGNGNEKSDAAGTGLALLPLLGDGHTHKSGKYKANVERGIKWLLANQKPDGDLSTVKTNAWMYTHGIATIALCEAYGMTKDPSLQEPAQRAVDFIVKAQHGDGGWRYQPGQSGDTSVVGWQMMALKSAQMGGLYVPAKTLKLTEKFIESQRDTKSGQIGYQGRNNGKPAMTAEGMLCLEYLGASKTDPRLHAAAKYMLGHLPKKGKDTSYYWYYGTQSMYHLQGDYWKQWNDAVNSTVLASQVNKGPMTGSWDPKDEWEGRGGRIMATSFRLLMLEVNYRHLPLYKELK